MIHKKYPLISLCFILFTNILGPIVIADEIEKNTEEKPFNAHYYFAHRLLPNYTFNDSYSLIGYLEIEGEKGLQSLLRDTTKENPNLEHPIDPNELSLVRISPTPTIDYYLITMPKAVRPPEAIFCAIIIDKMTNEVSYRAYEMSFGENMTPGGSVVYGGWLSNMRHINMGNNKDFTKEAFIEQLNQEFINKEAPQILGSADINTKKVTTGDGIE